MKESLVTLFERRVLLIVKSSIFFKLLLYCKSIQHVLLCINCHIFACMNWGHAVPLPNQCTRFEFQDFFIIFVFQMGAYSFEDDTP